MCGICGILTFDGSRPDEDLLRRMNGTLTHRGPDGEGYYTDGPAALAMRRLAIIDLATGDQPQFDENRTTAVVFNGEIFNYRQIRAELQAVGHQFKSESDTESLPHLYEAEGPDGARRLNGMFAFAVWDAPRQKLTLVRDHFGVKPLYYAATNRGLYFASELPALLEVPGIDRDLDLHALDQYLAFRYIPAPRTIYRGIRKLPPGTLLEATQNGLAIRPYWDVSYPPAGPPANEDGGWPARVREQVERAVEAQMVSDVPLGAFLSGGVDSSIVVGVMSRVADRPVKTYSVGFAGWADFDEMRYARLAAEHFGTDHHEIQVTPNAAELLPLVVAAFAEPMADPAAIPTYLIAREAARDLKVVLTGEGADELFGGYGWYGWRRRFGIALPESLRSRALQIVTTMARGRRGKYTLASLFQPTAGERYLETVASSVFTTPERRSLYAPAVADCVPAGSLRAEFDEHLERAAGLAPRSALQYLDTKIWLEGDPLVKVDRMSMAVSLEARVPFLDIDLVELAATIPPDLHVRNGRSKAVLREAFADLLPAAILDRPKHAFEVPVGSWLRGDLRNVVRTHLSPDAPAIREYFRPEAVKVLVQAHLSGHRDLSRELWTLLTFSLWYEQVRR